MSQTATPKQAPPAAGPVISPSLERGIMGIDDIKALISQGKVKEAQVELDKLNQLQQLRQYEKSVEEDQKIERDRTQRAALAKQMAMEEYDRMKKIAAAQALCERLGHKREDGMCALVGQVDSRGILRSTCQRCHKSYVDIGTGAEKLPDHIAATIPQDAIGRIL